MSFSIDKTIKELRQNRVDTVYHPQEVGFLGRDEMIEHRQVGPSPAERNAADILEGLTQYLCHHAGCSANDLDYLDDSPCTCGLRRYYNPKGTVHDDSVTTNSNLVK